ncbi:helix-turn-helix transcriptional regulator [Longispora albida]|uniref:helix-turn-helix transcriptional regulator n=1 Tax=Longispora albida TaxID=203523 RepID=UPI0003A0872E|nr:LuxR C-terminal-related transcriptional regulator [Longispora albida]
MGLENLPSLTRFGLPLDADLVYRTLSADGQASTPTLACRLGMDRDLVTAELAALENNGLVVQINPPALDRNNHPWWAAVVADKAIVALHRRRFHNRAARIDPTLKTIEAAAATNPLAGIRILPLETVSARHLALLGSARHDIMHLCPAFTASPVNVEASRRTAALVAQARQRGARFRDVSLVGAPEALSSASSPNERGDQRQAADVAGFLTIIDHRTALVSSLVRPVVLEVDEPTLVAGLHHLFEHHWNAAAPPDPGPDLTPRQQNIIALLAQGHTDTVIAERLHVSARTIAYDIHALMEAHGATSRFQLATILTKTEAGLPPPQEPQS